MGTELIRFLGRIEHGFCIFLLKKSKQAEVEGKIVLSKQLEKHAKQEDGHARMLWGILDGASRPKRNCATTLFTENPSYFIGEPIDRFSNQCRQLQSLDGISKRYLIFRVLFGDKSASDYEWADTLAFMCIGEFLGEILYLLLTLFYDKSTVVYPVFRKIAHDESSHSQYLWVALIQDHGKAKAYCYLLKWILKFTFTPIFLGRLWFCKKLSKSVFVG